MTAEGHLPKDARTQKVFLVRHGETEWSRTGKHTGRTTRDIRREVPGWSVWTSAIIDGESLEDVAVRARRVIDQVLEAAPEDVALFAHGHILRVLAACRIEQPPIIGQALALDTATISVLGYERETRVIRRCNIASLS